MMQTLLVEEILRERFGLEGFRPGQERVIGALLGDPPGSALAVFPTGGGKSLCYQLPAVALAEAGEGTTLVVSPLISLMKDQIDALRRRGVRAARLDSSVSAAETGEAEGYFRDGSLALLYVSPERFNNQRFLDLLDEGRIAAFAVDEAHCISEWGHAFRPDYLKLQRVAEALGVKRKLALTATATPKVVEDVGKAFGVAEENRVVTGFYRPNLKILTTPVLPEKRDRLLLKRLSDTKRREPGPTIVYVTQQKEAERVAKVISEGLGAFFRGRAADMVPEGTSDENATEVEGRILRENFGARAYHAGMDPGQREEVQEWWARSSGGIVCATIAFGMGIDRADVRYVYHYNLAKSLEGYSQEIGRAGRDGEVSVVEMFACPDDLPVLAGYAHGDVPHRGGVLGAVREVLQEVPTGGEGLAVNLYEMSGRHDVKLPVLKTLLTYLELGGFLKQGTPFYSTYKLRFGGAGGREEAARAVGGVHGRVLLEGVFSPKAFKEGRVWLTVDPDEAARAAGCTRDEVVRAIQALDEGGHAEVAASGVVNRFFRDGCRVGEPEDLAERLYKKMLARESGELERLGGVVEFVEHAGCQTNLLASYFGEDRDEPCGHCSSCAGVSEEARALPQPPAIDAAEALAAAREGLEHLRREHPDALGAARQQARFVCGLRSPATARLGLVKHELFGALSEARFGDILAVLEGDS